MTDKNRDRGAAGVRAESLEPRLLLSAYLVKDIDIHTFHGSPSSSGPRQMADVNGTLYFTAGVNPVREPEPWVSDGTPDGTRPLGAMFNTGSFTGPYTRAAGKTFLLQRTTNNPEALWSTDGTAAGTVRCYTAPANWILAPEIGTPAGLYFTVGGGELFFSDGTAAGTKLLSADPGGIPEQFISLPNGGVEFLARQSLDTAQLWTSDGTPAGTQPLGPRVSLDTVGPPTSDYVRMTPGDYLNGDDYVEVDETPLPGAHFTPRHSIWRISPTGATRLAEADGLPAGYGSTAGSASPPVNLNGAIYFLVAGTNLDPTVTTLERFDGTTAAPVAVAKLPGMQVVYQRFLSGNRFFFFATSPDVTSGSLWVSDGTAAGTTQVAPLATANYYNAAIDVNDAFVAADGAVFFGQGSDLWVSDGTPDGTGLVAAGVLPSPPVVEFYQLVPSGGKIFFNGIDAAHGVELWAADITGSVAGSVFNDANHNGTQDAGETGLAEVTIYLDSNDNGKLDPGEPSAVTAADGTYSLTGLKPGAATIRQVLPAGYRQTTPQPQKVVVHPALAASGPVFGDVQVSAVPLDFSYLLALAQNYGKQGTFATGDLTGDGTVNFDDLLLLSQNYGHALPDPATLTKMRRRARWAWTL